MAEQRGGQERRHAVLVARVDLGTVSEESPNTMFIAVRRSTNQIQIALRGMRNLSCTGSGYR